MRRVRMRAAWRWPKFSGLRLALGRLSPPVADSVLLALHSLVEDLASFSSSRLPVVLGVADPLPFLA